MNIFFNNSSDNATFSKVASSQEIPNIKDTVLSDYFHYIDFTIPIYLIRHRKKITTIIDQILLSSISIYRCNTIILNRDISEKIYRKHMILKFITLIDLFNFVNNINSLNIPIHINSIRCIHNTLIENINQSSELEEPVSPSNNIDHNNHNNDNNNHNNDNNNHNYNDDSDHNDDSNNNDDNDSDHNNGNSNNNGNMDDVNSYESENNDDENLTQLYKIFKNEKTCENNMIIFLSGSEPYYTKFEQDTEINQLAISIFNNQSKEINETISCDYLNKLITKSMSFSMLKTSMIDSKNYKKRIIKVAKPKVKTTLDNYMLCSSITCNPYIEISDDDTSDDDTSEGEIDVSNLRSDKYITNLSHNSNKILHWIGHSKNKPYYVIMYNNEPCLQFSDKEKASIYIKHIATMVIEQLCSDHNNRIFKLEKIPNGYNIQKCIWNFLLPIYINVSTITLHKIFEI